MAKRKSFVKKTEPSEDKQVIYREFVKRKNYLALDIASKKSGWALYENEICVASGVIEVVGKSASERFPKMAAELCNLIECYQPKGIVVEAAFMGTNFKSTEYLVKLQGVIEYEAKRRNILFTSIVTTAWRAALSFPLCFTSKGGQMVDYKKLSMEYAHNILCVPLTDDNETDAICIGAAICILSKKEKTNFY